MKNDFVGIMDIDYPELTSDERRQIQLGEMTVLPDGKTVREYAADVEILKQITAEEASQRREADLSTQTFREPITNTRQEKREEHDATEPTVPDEDEVEDEIHRSYDQTEEEIPE